MKYFLVILMLINFSAAAEEVSIAETETELREELINGLVDINNVLKLGKIYEDRGEVKKAIKVYLFGIKELHSSSWKDIKRLDELNEIMVDLKKPSEDALTLAYKVGILYYDLYLVDSSSEEFSIRILDTASKYFLICEFFKFNLAKTKYFLGMIYKENGNYKKASISFLKSWELYRKSQKVDKDLEQKFELLLGESFLNHGYMENGLALLRAAYYHKNGNRFLQNYAKEYLNEFKGSSVGGSISLSYGSDSNVLIGNDSDSASIKSSTFSSKNASLFLSHAPSYSSQYNFSTGFSEELYTEGTLNDNDSRSLSFTSSWDYKKYDKKILTTSYVFSKNYSRPNVDQKFEADYDFHEISPSLKFFKKRNEFSVSMAFSRSIFDTGGQLDKVGVGASYSYLSFSKYWNPEARVDLSSEEEDDDYEKSKIITIALSNSLEILDGLSLSVDLTIEKKTNSDSSLGYSERVLDISGYYSFERIEGLSIEGNLSNEASTSEESTSESRVKFSLGLSYYL